MSQTTPKTTYGNTCPTCGKPGRVSIDKKSRRVLLACPPCDMATDAAGAWTFYVGGVTK